MLPSSIDLSPMLASVGAEFTSLTMIERVCVALIGGAPLSVTTTLMAFVLGPCASVGVQEKTPPLLMLAPGGTLPAKLKVSVWLGRSESVAVTVKGNSVPSSTVWLAILGMTGATFTSLTIIVIVSEAL